MKLDTDHILTDIGFYETSSYVALNQMSSTPILDSNLLDIMPDYMNDKQNLIFEANLQYTGSNSYVAMYKSTVEVKENIIYPIVISRGKTTAAHFTKRNDWRCYQLIYTHFGLGTIYLNNRMYELKPGSIFLLDCRPYHYFFANEYDGWEYSLIHFDGGNSNYLCNLVESKSLLYNNMAASRAMQKFNRIFELSREDSPEFELTFHELMTEFLVSLCSGETHAIDHKVIPSWLSSVQSYIAENYNHDICIDELAKMTYLSPSRFAHRFKELVGSSPIEYQYEIRISNAKECLDATDLPLSEVCERVGFHNEANFYARFKKTCGVSPGKYRMRARNTKNCTSD
ncbi:MAG: AraC family transcriptional regulator [Clostridia bacterium]